MNTLKRAAELLRKDASAIGQLTKLSGTDYRINEMLNIAAELESLAQSECTYQMALKEISELTFNAGADGIGFVANNIESDDISDDDIKTALKLADDYLEQISKISSRFKSSGIARLTQAEPAEREAPQLLLSPADIAALRRFAECCEDSDSGGHDVSKEAMRRLELAGAVRSLGFRRHETTKFGDYVLEDTAPAPDAPSLCSDCTRADVSCPIYPQETQHCVEYRKKQEGGAE